MDKHRMWIVGAVLAIVAVLSLGWFLGISPKLDEARAANGARETVEIQNAAYAAQIETLKKQFEGIDELNATLADLRIAVPISAAIPAFVSNIDTIGQAHQVLVTAINVSSAQAYAPPAVAVDATPPADADAEAESDAADVEVAADAIAPTAQASGDIALVANSLITAENFVSIPITLTIEGGYDNTVDFLQGLQQGNRLVSVTSFNILEKTATATGDADAVVAAPGSNVTATISLLVFVLREPAVG